MRIHIVQKGDSLWSIAKQYGVDFEALVAENKQLANENELQIGMKIYLPEGNRYGYRLDEERPSMPKNRQQAYYRQGEPQGSLEEQLGKWESERMELEQKQQLYPRDLRQWQANDHRYVQQDAKRDERIIGREQMVCSYCMQPLQERPSAYHPYYEQAFIK